MSLASKFKKFFIIKKKYGYKKSMAIALNYIFKRHIFVIDQPTGTEYEDLHLFNDASRYKKTVLFFSNELIPTGAPIALMSAINAFMKLGYKPFVISFRSGNLFYELKKMRIPVIVSEEALYNPEFIFKKINSNFDLIFANTFASGKTVDYCEKKSMKTIWWIHEGASLINMLSDFLPRTKTFHNTRILAISDVAGQALQKHFPNTNYQILPLGGSFKYSLKPTRKNNDIVLLIYVSDPFIKGFDILEKGLTEVKTPLDKQLVINVVGNNNPLKFSNSDKRFVFKARMDHESMLKEIVNSDLILIPSREETFSIMALEALRLKKPFIASDIIGLKPLLPKYIYNDFFFDTNNPFDLSKKINSFLDNRKKYNDLSKRLYIDCAKMFSEDSLKENISSILKSFDTYSE